MTAQERLLADLLAEVRGLRADFARFAGREGPRDQEDAALLPAIGRAVGSRAFTCRELLQLAETDRALAEAIADTTSDSPRQLGKLLARLAGRPIAGWRLARVDEDRHGLVWQVQVCECETRKLAQ